MSNYKCSYGKNCECKTDEEKSTCDLAFETKTKMSKETHTSKLVHGESCPICGTTLEWDTTRECDNCGYDKP